MTNSKDMVDKTRLLQKLMDSSTSRDENHVEEKRELVPEEIPVPSINFDRLSYYKCNKVNLKHIVFYR